jgi:MFS family permease
MAAQWVLAAGVLAPVLWLNVVTLLTAAVCVGGTFMVITMAGIREVLRVGGPQASRGVGMMTAAFAAGQIAGPLTVSLLAGSSSAFTVASIIAALALVVGNCVLSISRARRQRTRHCMFPDLGSGGDERLGDIVRPPRLPAPMA